MKAIKSAILGSVLLALAGFIFLTPGTASYAAPQTPPEIKPNSYAQNRSVKPTLTAQNASVDIPRGQKPDGGGKPVKKGVRRPRVAPKV